jgi:hypothetical protein
MTSAQRKLLWGIKRVEELSRETLTYEHSKAYVPRVERDVRSPQEIKYSVFAVEREAPSADWPLMAGEVIQTLRSALDHAVYAAARGRGKTQFPIFTDACEFQVKGRPQIKGVPKAVRTLIERAQPYNRLPEHPSFDTLAVLSKLSNLDKHRTLATVAGAVTFPFVGTNKHVRLDWHKAAVRFETLGSEDTEILSFTATSDSEIEDVDVDPDFTYEVHVEGRPLISILVDSCKRVFELIVECESGQPMPMIAHYPIQQPLPGRHLDGSFVQPRKLAASTEMG